MEQNVFNKEIAVLMYVHKKDENQNVFTISDYNTFGGNHYYEKKLFLCSGEKNDVFWNVL